MAHAPAPVRTVIVDDDEDVRALLRLQFELDGRFEVVGEGADGDQAVELAGRLHPDLLVLDRHMPRRGGVEAIAPVREVSPTTAIVLYTATADRETYNSAMAAGALYVLEKVAGTEFIEAFSAMLLDRTACEEATEVRIGPVAAHAARTWVGNSRSIVAAVRQHPEVVSVPADALDVFESLLDEWEEAARDAEEFVWVARAEVAEVLGIVEHWAVVDAMSDEQLARLGVHWSPPEGQPFFEALTAGVLAALERYHDTARLRARLVQQWAPYRRAPEG